MNHLWQPAGGFRSLLRHVRFKIKCMHVHTSGPALISSYHNQSRRIVWSVPLFFGKSKRQTCLLLLYIILMLSSQQPFSHSKCSQSNSQQRGFWMHLPYFHGNLLIFMVHVTQCFLLFILFSLDPHSPSCMHIFVWFEKYVFNSM